MGMEYHLFVFSYWWERFMLIIPQPSTPRRYGPRAAAAPIPASQSLLSPTSSISDRPSFAQPRSSYAVQSSSYQSDLTGYGGLDEGIEADDDLHNPDPKRGRRVSILLLSLISFDRLDRNENCKLITNSTNAQGQSSHLED